MNVRPPRFAAPLLTAFALLVTGAPAFAGISSAIIVLPTDSGRPTPAVNLVQPADYLCAIVTVRSTAKDIDRQSAAMRDSLQRIMTAVEKSPRFQLHQGAARLAGSAASFSSGTQYSSKSGTDPAALQTSLRILAPLQGNADVVESMRQLRRFISGLTPADDTEFTVVSITPAVTEPEQYRARLLALIADQARAIQQNFATRAIIIDGLQNPVVVRQLDDSNIELFVEYQLSATLETR